MPHTRLTATSRTAETTDIPLVEDLLRKDHYRGEKLARAVGAYCIGTLKLENADFFKQQAIAITNDETIDTQLLFIEGDLEAAAIMSPWTKEDSARYTIGGNLVSTIQQVLGKFREAKQLEIVTKDATIHSATNEAFDLIVPRDGRFYATIPTYDTEKQELLIGQSFRANRTAKDTDSHVKKTLYVRHD